MKIRQAMTRILDRERARVAAERRAADLREDLERERETAAQYRTANVLMEDRMRRASEQVARERSMLDDQWAAYERVTQDRDFWKHEAEVYARKLAEANAEVDRLRIERKPLRLVKEGAA